MNTAPTIFDAVLERLHASSVADLRRIARESGVPEGTLRKIRYGEVKNPRVRTVQALHDYFVTELADNQPDLAKEATTAQEPSHA